MKESSPFQTILLVVFGFFAALGIWAFVSGGERNSQDGREAWRGDFVVWGTLPRKSIQGLLVPKDANYSITYVEKNLDTLEKDLLNAWARDSKSAPDVVILPQEWSSIVENDVALFPYESLSVRRFNDLYISGASVLARADGFAGLPLLADPLVLYWNRDIFNTMDVDPPQTWDDVIATIPRLVTFDQSRNITRAAIPLGTYDNITNAKAIVLALFEQADVDFKKASTLRKPLDFFLQFSNVNNRGVYTWDSNLPDSRDMFLAGDAAMYIGRASEAGEFSRMNPHLNFDVAVLPQQRTALHKREVTGGSLISAYVMSRAHDLSGAYFVATKLADPETVAQLAKALSLVPARLDILKNPPADDPYTPIFYDSTRIMRVWVDPKPAESDEIFRDLINDIITKRRSVAESIKYMLIRLGYITS